MTAVFSCSPASLVRTTPSPTRRTVCDAEMASDRGDRAASAFCDEDVTRGSEIAGLPGLTVTTRAGGALGPTIGQPAKVAATICSVVRTWAGQLILGLTVCGLPADVVVVFVDATGFEVETELFCCVWLAQTKT